MLYASGRQDDARQLVTRLTGTTPVSEVARELGAANQDLPSFVTLMHARWLIRHGRTSEAKPLLERVRDQSRNELLRWNRRRRLGRVPLILHHLAQPSASSLAALLVRQPSLVEASKQAAHVRAPTDLLIWALGRLTANSALQELGKRVFAAPSRREYLEIRSAGDPHDPERKTLRELFAQYGSAAPVSRQ